MIKLSFHPFSNHGELEAIQYKYQLPEAIMASLKDPNELSHIRYLHQHYFLVVSVLYHYQEHIKLASIAILVQADQVVFVVPSEVAHHDIEQHLDLSSSSSVLASFFVYLYQQYELRLLEVKNVIMRCENEMFSNIRKDNIKELFICNQSLATIQSGLLGLGQVMNTIMTRQPESVYDVFFEETYTDIQIESKQVERMLKSMQESVSSILSTTSSLQDNRLNRTMKTLTAITLVLSIPTFITSFYGMNIDLPFQDHPQSLLIVSISSFILTLVSVIILYRKDLL